MLRLSQPDGREVKGASVVTLSNVGGTPGIQTLFPLVLPPSGVAVACEGPHQSEGVPGMLVVPTTDTAKLSSCEAELGCQVRSAGGGSKPSGGG